MSTTMKAIELVMDWNMWPRQSAQTLDSTNVARMREFLRVGGILPPVVINAKDYRIVDGFHRTRAHIDVYGDEADIEVIAKNYAKDSEMFVDAGRLNSSHGLPMGPKDRAHFIAKCRKMKIPYIVAAEAIGMNVDSMKKFFAERTARTESGEVIPLSAGGRGLAGKILTPAQEHFARTSNGAVPEMYISMLINALRADAVQLSDRTISRLRELDKEIQMILDGVA